MRKQTVEDLSDRSLNGSRVLLRVDYNVPLGGGRVTDDARIRATLPTLRYLLERNAGVILMSHLGRPKGEWRDEYSLQPAADTLAEFQDNDTGSRFVVDTSSYGTPGERNAGVSGDTALGGTAHPVTYHEQDPGRTKGDTEALTLGRGLARPEQEPTRVGRDAEVSHEEVILVLEPFPPPVRPRRHRKVHRGITTGVSPRQLWVRHTRGSGRSLIRARPEKERLASPL
jgi:hypothetical protein